MDDCLKRQAFYCHPGRAGGFPLGANSSYELLRKKYTRGDFFCPHSKVAACR
jgi:hypothetical protein